VDRLDVLDRHRAKARRDLMRRQLPIALGGLGADMQRGPIVQPPGQELPQRGLRRIDMPAGVDLGQELAIYVVSKQTPTRT
jgi:hypothetical protein